jgi:dCMP deaminase
LRLSVEAYALALARTASLRSEDPYQRVGAALIRHDKTVAALGYNGTPSGVEIDWEDRSLRRPFVVHAEANALRYVRPGEVELVAVTMMPCLACLQSIASYGITRVVYEEELDPLQYPVEQIRNVARVYGIDITKEKE